MAWDWLDKGARRLQEIGGEYKQHHALVERLLALEPPAAQDELVRVWQPMDDRARAALKMTLAGLTLTQHAAASGAEAKVRLERLKALQVFVEQAGQPNTPGGAPGTREARFTAGAARITSKLADVTERARPKAEQLVESARKGIEKHAPAVEAAVKSAIDELVRTEAAQKTAPPPPIPKDPPAPATSPEPATASTAGATSMTGQWTGTLRQPGDGSELGCDLQVAPSGRPVWAFHDTSGYHQRELTAAGQRIQYVPPGGGVTTVTVQSVTGSAVETGYVVDYSFEGTSNGYLTQKYQRIALTGRLRGSQLDVTYAEAGTSAFGDKTGLAATEGTSEYRGLLNKQA
jgi:hypothetical protein